jgi:hypothetical protein
MWILGVITHSRGWSLDHLLRRLRGMGQGR